MKLLHCSRCGQRVFFDNTRCESCGASLGFVPSENEMVSFEVQEEEVWSRLGPDGPAERPCTNYALEGVCNWMVGADDASPLCISCRTTRIIPALTKPENKLYWASLEQAKRRLFYTLISLKLPAPSVVADPVHGLSFHFLEQMDPGHRVLTGHDEGLITLNIAEADDTERERVRSQMNEPYRSLVGHFRHESGHYYWDRLINNTSWIEPFRELFGDERADYDAALKQHYATPMVDWHLSHISAYASSHPWEDWAECWAHYLHMVDGLETAAAWGLHLDHAVPNGASLAAMPVPASDAPIGPSIVEQWLPVSQFCNAMNRSLGLHDSYPFVVRAPVVAKLEFIHRVIAAAAHGAMPMNFSSPAAIEPVLEPEAAAAVGQMPPPEPEPSTAVAVEAAPAAAATTASG